MRLNYPPVPPPRKFCLRDGVTGRLHRSEPELVDPFATPSSEVAEASIADRKLALLQKSGVFSSDTKGCTFERACTLPELRAAYRLVHDVFVSNGFILPESGGVRLRIFEACPETATFIAKKDGEVVGVLSVVIDSPEIGLPSDLAFRSELDALRETGTRFCELTNQAVAKDYRRSGVLTELMRCAIAYILEAGCDRALATVSPSHTSFYQLLGFRQLGEKRSYSTKLDDPVVALTVDLTERAKKTAFASSAEQYICDFMLQANRFRSRAAEWSGRAADQFLSVDLLSGLLFEQRNFLRECSVNELLQLRERWGETLFDLIWQRGAVTAAAPIAQAFDEACKPLDLPGDLLSLKEIFQRYFPADRPWWGQTEPTADEQ